MEAVATPLGAESITLSPSALRARLAVEEALGSSLKLWHCDAPGHWRRGAATGRDDSNRSLVLNDEQLTWITALVEQAQRSAAARRAPLDDRIDAVAVPLLERSGDVRAVGVAMVAASDAGLIERLANLALKESQQREENEWLREENFVFSQQVTDDFEELTFLRSMATHLVVKDASLNICHLVDKTINGLREMIGAEAIYFVTPTSGGYAVAQSCCASPDPVLCVSHEAVTRLAAVNAHRAEDNPCVRNDLETTDPEAWAAGVRQFLMVTIATAARGFGWFVAVNRCNAGRMWKPSPLLQIGHDEFGTWEASLLSAAATLVASHASNLDLIREKEGLLISTVRSLVTALDSKDAYTRGHSERVALFSKRIAEQLGYEPAAAERLYLTGLLHDVGKIGVSDAVLRKPDKLTDEEFAEIKRHPDEGWSILRDLEPMNYVLPGVLHHHEQINGTGYPDGLAGDQIPLDARIMAVADAYDAMTSDRAYRAGMPHEKAVGILRSGAGSQWDAQCVDAFLAAIDDIIAIRYDYKPVERECRAVSALAPNCQT
jgi:HD-GYP domain-containing protein (c-di-GMP phosphodiesterase class II)